MIPTQAEDVLMGETMFYSLRSCQTRRVVTGL